MALFRCASRAALARLQPVHPPETIRRVWSAHSWHDLNRVMPQTPELLERCKAQIDAGIDPAGLCPVSFKRQVVNYLAGTNGVKLVGHAYATACEVYVLSRDLAGMPAIIIRGTVLSVYAECQIADNRNTSMLATPRYEGWPNVKN